MREYFNNLARKKIVEITKKHYNKINVNSGECKFNFRCHNNAVHEAVVNNHDKIVMCVYIDDGYPIVHFINYINGEFVDNTVGIWSTQYEYYFVEWIGKEDFFNVYNYHDSQRNLFKYSLPWWIRIFSDYRG